MSNISQFAQAWLILGVSNSLPVSMIKILKEDQPEPQIKQLSIVKKLEQNKFIKSVKAEVLIGAWFVDILIELKNGTKIIVELDGGQHYRDGVLRLEDQRRDAWLEKQGFSVLRFKNNVAIDDIIKEVERRFCSPSPSKIGFFAEGQVSEKKLLATKDNPILKSHQ
jgi:very-short-patch-repair endonuclease